MFKCEQCVSTFTRKDNLVTHQKKHSGVCVLCTICTKSFENKSNLNRHIKNVHGMYILLLLYLKYFIIIYFH